MPVFREFNVAMYVVKDSLVVNPVIFTQVTQDWQFVSSSNLYFFIFTLLEIPFRAIHHEAFLSACSLVAGVVPCPAWDKGFILLQKFQVGRIIFFTGGLTILFRRRHNHYTPILIRIFVAGEEKCHIKVFTKVHKVSRATEVLYCR